jgi:ATP-dependent RNA helicase DDX1
LVVELTADGRAGKKSNRKQFDTYGEAYGKNDVIGCFIDCDEGTIHFAKNGRSLDKAFDIPPRGFAFYPGDPHMPAVR